MREWRNRLAAGQGENTRLSGNPDSETVNPDARGGGGMGRAMLGKAGHPDEWVGSVGIKMPIFHPACSIAIYFPSITWPWTKLTNCPPTTTTRNEFPGCDNLRFDPGLQECPLPEISPIGRIRESLVAHRAPTDLTRERRILPKKIWLETVLDTVQGVKGVVMSDVHVSIVCPLKWQVIAAPDRNAEAARRPGR